MVKTVVKTWDCQLVGWEIFGGIAQKSVGTSFLVEYLNIFGVSRPKWMTSTSILRSTFTSTSTAVHSPVVIVTTSRIVAVAEHFMKIWAPVLHAAVWLQKTLKNSPTILLETWLLWNRSNLYYPQLSSDSYGGKRQPLTGHGFVRSKSSVGWMMMFAEPFCCYCLERTSCWVRLGCRSRWRGSRRCFRILISVEFKFVVGVLHTYVKVQSRHVAAARVRFDQANQFERSLGSFQL